MSQSSGTALTRFNAVRHGVLSAHTVLPWEDADAYADLLAALVAEHAPEGPTEEHLVEELTGVIWRKRRLRLAEGAAAKSGLRRVREFGGSAVRAALAREAETVDDSWINEAVTMSPDDVAAQLRDMEEDESLTVRALSCLRASDDDAYEQALGALREDTRSWWLEEADEAVDRPQPLQRFLETRVMPWFARRRRGLEAAPAIRGQAEAEALDQVMTDRLARYEVHLDRKLERVLAMLIKLRQLREGA